jgi:hypothetical protein
MPDIKKYPYEIKTSNLGALVERGFTEFFVWDQEDEIRAVLVQSDDYGNVIAGFNPHGSVQDILIFLAEKGLDKGDMVLRYMNKHRGLPNYKTVKGVPSVAGPYDLPFDISIYDKLYPLLMPRELEEDIEVDIPPEFKQ